MTLHGTTLWPVDLEGEAGGSELDEPKPVVPGKSVYVAGLKVAEAPIVILELTLQEEVRLGGRRIVVGGGVSVLEQHLKVKIIEVANRNVASIELHRRDHLQSWVAVSVAWGHDLASAAR